MAVNLATTMTTDLFDGGDSLDTFGGGGFAGTELGGPSEVVNLSGIDSTIKRERLVFPPGIYEARVVSIYLKQAKSSLKWHYEFCFEAYDRESRSVRVYDYKTLFEKDKRTLAPVEDLARLKALVLKLKPDFDFSRLSPQTLSDACIGVPVKLKLQVGEPYNGQRSNKIAGDDGVMPTGQDF